jgi:hypothetical protein
MELQQQTPLVLLARNASTLISSQNKINPLFISSVSTSIITAITISSNGLASLSTQWAL